jgi:protein-L-isoaspartate(D-aspartate) O-methyltransferase
MMNDQGTVIGIEHIPSLVKKSIDNIKKNHGELLKNKKVIIIEGDGRKGFEAMAPYDCIHVGAAADKLPQPLVDQLAKGGRMVKIN